MSTYYQHADVRARLVEFLGGDSPKTVRVVTQQIRDLGIEPYSFHAPFAEHIDISVLDVHARERALTEPLQAAATLQARYFIIHPGPEQRRFPDSERFARRKS